MKKYELILQGGKTLILTEEEKSTIEKSMLNRESVLMVSGNRFKSSMIKGIFEIKQEVSDNKEMWIQSNREWHNECLKLSKRSINQKVDSEFAVRIFPGLKLNNIKLTDETIAVMEANVRAYFEALPNNPRCPMKIWWPFIAEAIAPVNEKTKKRANPNLSMGKWWNFISRNDDAIAEWSKYNG